MIKLFVGCAPNGEDAESQMVLEYTARKHTSMPLDIVWMKISNDPSSYWHGWDTKLWSTPFSGFRWGIPEFCDFQGQAIYMDSDMIINADLAELWNAPFEKNKSIMGKGGWRFCVAKWNCDRAGHHVMPVSRLKSIPEFHSRMFNYFSVRENLVQLFDRQWNNFDGENDNLSDIKILHYTDMSTQPHFKYALPRLEKTNIPHWYDGEIRTHRRNDVAELFDREYNSAINEGYTVEKYLPAQDDIVEYIKQSQKGYTSSNGFDVTKGE